MAAARSREVFDPAHVRSERLDVLYRRHADFVWRCLKRLGVLDSHLDDALQDVFLVVHRRLDGFDDRGAARAWLFAISRRVASDLRRSHRRGERKLRALGSESSPPDVEHDVAAREAVQFVHEFLATLDEPRRLVFYLSEVEGLSGPEIAASLEVNLNTVYTRLRAARRSFDQAIARQAERERQTT